MSGDVVQVPNFQHSMSGVVVFSRADVPVGPREYHDHPPPPRQGRAEVWRRGGVVVFLWSRGGGGGFVVVRKGGGGWYSHSLREGALPWKFHDPEPPGLAGPVRLITFLLGSPASVSQCEKHSATSSRTFLARNDRITCDAKNVCFQDVM